MERFLCVAVVLAACAGCPGGDDDGAADAGTRPDGGGFPDGGSGFQDFTQARLDSLGAFTALAESRAGGESVKFVITGFAQPAARGFHFLDSRAYSLHDEWYWFRLLNGQPMEGDATAPYAGHFASVPEVYAWAWEQAQLPLDLRFIGERLYSPRFYDLALTVTPQEYGLATLVHFPARSGAHPRAEIWAFELEYSDGVTHADLVTFFQELAAHVSGGVADGVKWLVRSAQHEALAQTMESQGLPYHDRILRYADLTTPGEVEVYSAGLVAGRLRRVLAGSSELASTRATDILVMDAPPDFLPQAAGLITAVPQTPLAHINVLARNRGIPNAYVAGAMEDPNLDQLARVAAPVALQAITPDQVRIVPITEQQYAQYRALATQPALSVEPVDVSGAPYVVDLSTLSFSAVDQVRPLIGGKCAGFLGLLAPGSVTTVDRPHCITIRSFVEHMAPLQARIAVLLAAEEFTRTARTRKLALEGAEAYQAEFSSVLDQHYLAEVLARPAGDPVADMVRDGGLVNLVQALPVATSTMNTIMAALEEGYGSYADTQALRFRSSSNVEDIEGFNGAGLYTSNTGFLHAERLADSGDRKKTVERALKQTWASYWGAEAFEERRNARVDHLSGAMGAVVHARFDDDKEVANGVFTHTLLPPGLPDVAVMVVNAQAGALSITNPPPGVESVPEVVVVRLPAGETEPVIERQSPSNQVPAGQLILDDGQLKQMFRDAHAVAIRWLEVENTPLLPSQRSRTLTLDLEFRDMAAGWPALAAGTPWPRRVVFKQARTLEPGLAAIPANLRNASLPRDVLARARRVEWRICVGAQFRVTFLDAFTNPLLSPDLGHTVEPFTGSVALQVLAAIPELGLQAGAHSALAHTAFTSLTHPGMAEGGAWGVHAQVSPGAVSTAGYQSLEMTPDLAWTLTNASGSATGAWISCERQILFSTPSEYLQQFFTSP